MVVPIGEAIKHLRKLRGLTHLELALRCDFPTSYVSKVENAHTMPGFENICKFAVALETEPHLLVKLSWRIYQSRNVFKNPLHSERHGC